MGHSLSRLSLLSRVVKEERRGGDEMSQSRSGRADRGEAARRSRKRGRGEPEEAPQTKKREGRGGRTIAGCISPRAIYLTRHSEFNCYEEDVWTEVAKYLDGQSLMRLGAVNRWFHHLMMDDSIWRYACLRDLQVPSPRRVSFKWLHVYTSAFGGSHSYTFRQQEKHIDWMRIGAFFFHSPVALLTERMPPPRRLPSLGAEPARTIHTTGSCIVSNLRTGIWIADLQLVRCPVCNLDTCQGTMQVLDARHAELFLEKGYQNRSWEYEEIGGRRSEKHSATATGGIFDVRQITDPCTADVLNVMSWMGQGDDWQPKARVCLHGVAINTNLQPNEGLQVKFHVMRSTEGEVVSLRISQQLI